MTVRPMRQTDIPVLKLIFAAQGFEYFFPDLTGPLIEAVHVVVDENDKPLCAVAAQRTIELYLFAGAIGPPHVRLHAIRLLHESLIPALKAKGYREVNAAIPPDIANSFGKRLCKTFDWVQNWVSFRKRF